MSDHHGYPEPAASAPPGRHLAPGVPPQQAPAPPLLPPQGPEVPRPGRVLRHWKLLLAAVVPCLVLAGIGWWAWPRQPSDLPLHVAAGTVEADLLTSDDVSRLAGTTLVSGPRSNRPATPVTVSPSNCAVVAGPTTQSVYGNAWTAFLSATYRDAGNTGAYTVNQVIGVFPDGEKAGAAFRTLTAGLTECSTSTRTDQAGRASTWAYQAEPPTEVAVAWTAAQDGSTNWACHRQARLKGASLVQVAVCQAGDGQPTTAKLAEALTGKVSG